MFLLGPSFPAGCYEEAIKAGDDCGECHQDNLRGVLVFNIIYTDNIINIDIFFPEHAPSEELLRGVHQGWQGW